MGEVYYSFIGEFASYFSSMRSCPGDLPSGNFCMSDLTSFGVNGLGGRVIGSEVSRKSCICFSIEGIVVILGLKTSERCCLCVSAFSLSFIAILPSGFLIGKEIVLIFKIFLVVFHSEPSFSDRKLICLVKFSERCFAICLLRIVHKLLYLVLSEGYFVLCHVALARRF